MIRGATTSTPRARKSRQGSSQFARPTVHPFPLLPAVRSVGLVLVILSVAVPLVSCASGGAQPSPTAEPVPTQTLPATMPDTPTAPPPSPTPEPAPTATEAAPEKDPSTMNLAELGGWLKAHDNESRVEGGKLVVTEGSLKGAEFVLVGDTVFSHINIGGVDISLSLDISDTVPISGTDQVTTRRFVLIGDRP